MVSRQTSKKANAHEVKERSYTPNGVHAFEIKSSESGETYHPRIKVLCDCAYMSVQGSANGKVCSHIIKAFETIKGGIE
jgi:hypothetical protein